MYGTRKDPNSQSHSEKAKQSWRHHNSGLQVILQSYSHQDSMVLAQKQTHISIEQNGKPRKGLATLWSTNPLQSREEYVMGKKTVCSTNGVGNTRQQHAKE